MNLKTCVDPSGQFIYGIHQPNFEVRNLRESDKIRTLGVDENNTPVDNHANFPSGTVTVDQADWVSFILSHNLLFYFSSSSIVSLISMPLFFKRSINGFTGIWVRGDKTPFSLISPLASIFATIQAV